MSKVLITGITGQDGAYLAHELLAKDYEVVGAIRLGSPPKMGRLDKLGIADKVRLVPVELTDFSSASAVLRHERVDYIYNLAAQSYVAGSFEYPHLTSEINYQGLLNILEAIKIDGLEGSIYQASSAEMYGDTLSDPQNEDTPFNPMSPYAVTKAAAHHLGRVYRASHGIKVSNGILFNHESELRGIGFVTRKITSELASIRECAGPAVRLGNLAAVRDWGYAPDYVHGMIMINEAKIASDYVLATNTVTSVRDFFKASAVAAGFSPVFEGDGLNERCICKNTSKLLCEVDEKYFRPSDVSYLRGDYSKIEKELGWCPTTSLETMTERMIISDIEIARSGYPPSF